MNATSQHWLSRLFRHGWAAGLLLGVGVASADTIQNFDAGGTAYDLAQNNVNPPPTITAGGPTGNFLRLASATAQQNVT